MMRHILIFISLCFATNASHSMEIIKKIIKKKENDYLIYKALHFAYTNTLLLHEINLCILSYFIKFKHQSLIKNEIFNYHWNDFNIPEKYYYFLTPKQTTLITNLLTQKYAISYCSQGQPNMFFYLNSQKDYDVFITLPQELRTCLTHLPNSVFKKSIYCQSQELSFINHNKSIFICRKNKHRPYMTQLILPEEIKESKKYKKTLDKLT